MLHFTSHSWDVPPLMDGKNSEVEAPPEEEAVDPGPLGLVAERIQLFDNGRLHGREGPGPFPYPWLQGTKERKSRTLGYQSAGKRVGRPVSYSSLSRRQLAGEHGAELARDSNNTRLAALFAPEGKPQELEKVQKLYQKLTVYSLFGLPRLPEGQRRLWAVGEGLKDLISPQSSWREFVLGHEALSRQQRHLQESIWELIQTEAAYLRNLSIITDLFLAGLLNLQASGLLLDVNAGCMFSNMPDIVRAHQAFWQEVWAPFLAQARVRGRLDPVELNQALSMFPSRFECYRTYCLSEGPSLAYAHQTQRTNPLFANFLKWAETHKQGQRMRLNDALAKPHQHLTRYPLLLRAVLRRAEGEAARDLISATINTIDSFIRSIDWQMQVRAEQHRLAELADSLQTYEAVDGISEEVDMHLQEFWKLDLLQPVAGCGPECVRSLVLAGPLRMRESRDSKIDVHCLLLTDMFLIAKALKRGKKAKVIRQPLILDKLVLRELKDQTCFLLMYISDLGCLVSAHVFQCPSRESCQEWISSLISTQKRLEILRTKESCLGQSSCEKPSLEAATTEGSVDLGATPDVEAEEAEVSPEKEDTPSIPPVLVTLADDPVPGTGPGQREGARRSPLSRRRPRSCSPHLVGAQRLIQRHLRRVENEKGHGRAAEPEGELTAAGRIPARDTGEGKAAGPGLKPPDSGRQTPAGSETVSRDSTCQQTLQWATGPPESRGQPAAGRESEQERAGSEREPDSWAQEDRDEIHPSRDGVAGENQTSRLGGCVQETLERAKSREIRRPEAEMGQAEPTPTHSLTRGFRSSVALDSTLSTTDV